jgi:hypothetical protein
VAGSTVTAEGEGSHGAAAVAGPQQVAATTEPQQSEMAAKVQQEIAAPPVVMTAAVTAPSVPPMPSPIDDSRATVVEIPDDDVPPPGWDQWVSLPVSAPEPPTGALVVRGDVSVALGGPANGVGASSSHAAHLTSGGPTARPK